MHAPEIKSSRYHIIVDIADCNNAAFSKERIETFVKDVIDSVGMKILVGPVTCEGVPENPGLTTFGVLDFSHVSLHSFSDHNDMLIDIFSCKEFDKDLVVKKCKEYFAHEDSIVRKKLVWWG